MTGAERLLKLADLLECLPAAKFILSWGIPYLPTPAEEKGCILGWALSIPEFQAEGLQIKMGMDKVAILSYDGAVGLEAAGMFFGLSVPDLWSNFTPDGYTASTRDGKCIAPALVAARMRILARAKVA